MTIYEQFWAERRARAAINVAIEQPLAVAALVVETRIQRRSPLADMVVRHAQLARIHADCHLASAPLEPACMDRGS